MTPDPFGIGKRLRLVFALLVASTLLLAGCAFNASQETSAEGTRSLDELPSTERDAAREEVRKGLMQGVNAYRLVAGDTLNVLYLNATGASAPPYVIGVGDRLKLEFHFVDEPPRQLLVRPDGCVTVPVKGDVRAVGMTPTALAEHIRGLFADIYKEPRVTVSVEQYNSRIEELRTVLTSGERGRSQRVAISPDGQVFLPYLPGVRVAGLTVDEVREQINQRYRQEVGNIEVSVLLEGLTGSRVMVFGEVPRPGLVPLSGNMTALQAVASAGGVLPSGSLANVKVLYWSDGDKEPRLRTLNLEEVIAQRKMENDLVLPGNTTIYVPPTTVVSAGRFVDQYLRQLFLFNGTSIGIQYGNSR